MTTTLPSARALAVAFVKELEESLTGAQLRSVRRRNAREVHPSVCHSHDFCDANMVMDAAFRTLGVDVSMDDDAHVDLWNEAWSFAFDHLLGGDAVKRNAQREEWLGKATRLMRPAPSIRETMIATSLKRYHEYLKSPAIYRTACAVVDDLEERRPDVVKDMVVRCGHTDWVWLEENVGDRARDFDFESEAYAAMFALASHLLTLRHPQIEIPAGHWCRKVDPSGLPDILMGDVEEALRAEGLEAETRKPVPMMPAPGSVRHDPVRATAERVIALLAAEGIPASWEFPGYLQVHVTGGFNLAYGTANVSWQGHYDTDEHGRIPAGWNPAELPPTATAEEIFAVLIEGVRQQHRARRVVTDEIEVTIEFRAPRQGEAGYWCTTDATPEQALAEVLRDRDVYGTGSDGTGYGWSAGYDYKADATEIDGCNRIVTVTTKITNHKEP